ncbi:hypothetical protein QUC31_001820 [Theobroma cacao]|uniref:Fatty acid desaturase A n=1 Tax=Theobroma cacao TaxID=3641 RepID=A0A061F6U4_THECC|nr:Fatty acid desaturase A [Theobroma cacao]
MSILPQHKYPLRPLTYAPTCPRLCCIARVTCSATTTKPRSSQNPLVIEPRLVTTPDLVTTIPSTGPPLPNDPSLQSTWSHRGWVASGCTTLVISLAKAMMGVADSHVWLEPMLAGYVGYIVADLLSAVYHWGIDNYGDASTPVFGSQIEGFQGHHKWPWIITRRQFANNLYALARNVTITVLPIDILCNDPVVQGFVSICAGCIMFSQQFHAWSHGTKSKLPPLVVALQDAGVLVSRLQHSAHHKPPYNSNYCIVSGVCNEFLDKNKVFEALEMVIFFKLGVRPRSWSEPGAEWTEETDETHPQVTVH